MQHQKSHYDIHVSAKLQTRPTSSIDADAPCEWGGALGLRSGEAWYQTWADILNHLSVNLLRARGGEEVHHNKTPPFIQYSVSLENASQHWSQLQLSVHGDLNIDIFQGIEVRNTLIMATNSGNLLS